MKFWKFILLVIPLTVLVLIFSHEFCHIADAWMNGGNPILLGVPLGNVSSIMKASGDASGAIAFVVTTGGYVPPEAPAYLFSVLVSISFLLTLGYFYIKHQNFVYKYHWMEQFVPKQP